MKIFHSADLHYCPKHLAWVDKAFRHAVTEAIGMPCDVAVIAGDSFDSSMGIHEPAFVAYVEAITILASHMPVLVLHGTYSHDRPGSLGVLKALQTPHPIYVADRAVQVALLRINKYQTAWFDLPTQKNALPVAIFSCLPSLNKAAPEVMEAGAREYVQQLCKEWAPTNLNAGVPTILVTHGTVTGCRTESGYAMVSPDHEFDEDTLYSAGADVTMLGHIHAHQQWSNEKRQCIAYPGSIARLVHGDHADKGFLTWAWDDFGVMPTFHAVPTRQFLEIDYDGPPDMPELKKLAARADENTFVRIRWSIDQEHAHSVDKAAIRALFEHAAECKLEGVVNPVQSVRAAGIGKAMTLREKLGYFAATTGDEDRLEDMELRLGMLQSMDVDAIVKKLTKVDKKEAA